VRRAFTRTLAWIVRLLTRVWLVAWQLISTRWQLPESMLLKEGGVSPDLDAVATEWRRSWNFWCEHPDALSDGTSNRMTPWRDGHRSALTTEWSEILCANFKRAYVAHLDNSTSTGVAKSTKLGEVLEFRPRAAVVVDNSGPTSIVNLSGIPVRAPKRLNDDQYAAITLLRRGDEWRLRTTPIMSTADQQNVVNKVATFLETNSREVLKESRRIFAGGLTYWVHNLFWVTVGAFAGLYAAKPTDFWTTPEMAEVGRQAATFALYAIASCIAFGPITFSILIWIESSSSLRTLEAGQVYLITANMLWIAGLTRSPYFGFALAMMAARVFFNRYEPL
jgi:hypothetical protein